MKEDPQPDREDEQEEDPREDANDVDEEESDIAEAQEEGIDLWIKSFRPIGCHWALRLLGSL